MHIRAAHRQSHQNRRHLAGGRFLSPEILYQNPTTVRPHYVSPPQLSENRFAAAVEPEQHMVSPTIMTRLIAMRRQQTKSQTVPTPQQLER